jgi:uncharacterized protein
MVGGNSPQVGNVARTHCANRTRESQKFFRTALSPVGGSSERAPRSFDTQGLFAEVKAIADTGFLVAFLNRRDMYHPWAFELAQRVREPLLTCDAVLAEAAFHVGSTALVLALVRDGLVLPSLNVVDHIVRLAELASRYADRAPDLADLCLIRLSELHPKHPVVTTDVNDFRIYRRGRREAIPLIHPPAS